MFRKISDFFSNYSTYLALAVAVFGVTLLVLGPVRSLIADNSGDVVNSASNSIPSLPTSGGEIVDGEVVVSRSLEPFTTVPDRPRDSVIGYTVEPGDTLEGIAYQFSLDRNTLFWSNSNTLGDNVHFLQAGISLNILPVDGVYHVADGRMTVKDIAAKYEVESDAILATPYNELGGFIESDVPPWGMKIVVPGGQREIVDWQVPITETVDVNTGQVSYGFMQGMSGSCSTALGGAGGTGAWMVPVNSYMVTQAFYPGHSGIDLGGVLGEPIMAADSGVVVFSGWVPANWGYGILVVLDHGNGWTTYYAHLNSTAVGCGQSVSRGQTIGYMGSTGNSSGSHLHFEMRWSHTPDNPALYMGF